MQRVSGEHGVAGRRAERLEGYGPGGVAVMIDCLTDDRDRTVAAVRRAFVEHGGQLGAEGSVSYLFQQTGVLSFAAGVDADTLMDAAHDAGAEDIVSLGDGSHDVLTAPADLDAVRAALARRGFVTGRARITQRAATSAPLTGATAVTMRALLRALEGLGDVRHVYSNAQFPDELLARLPA